MWPGGVGLTPGRTRGTVVMRPKGSGVWLTADARPDTCRHQMPPRIKARVLELRALHPGWGPRSILNASNEGAVPTAGRTSIYRALVRHQQRVDPSRRRRRTSDYKRRERACPMEPWQMDITGGLDPANGYQASIVTGADDHSRLLPWAMPDGRLPVKEWPPPFVGGIYVDLGSQKRSRFPAGAHWSDHCRRSVRRPSSGDLGHTRYQSDRWRTGHGDGQRFCGPNRSSSAYLNARPVRTSGSCGSIRCR